jgi:hypothetical protein
MPEHVNQSGVDLASEAVEEMAKYGIKYAQISQFFYGLPLHEPGGCNRRSETSSHAG